MQSLIGSRDRKRERRKEREKEGKKERKKERRKERNANTSNLRPNIMSPKGVEFDDENEGTDE